LELPQDVCAAPYNRVARFGKDSEPSLTAAGELFASGLSSNGRLTAGLNSQAFYGAPLVAWTPALGATAYEVQWSKKRYPFMPEPAPQNQNALGTMTLGTSTVLGHERIALLARSEEHTSELQSRENLVCRLLLEKKKINGVRLLRF